MFLAIASAAGGFGATEPFARDHSAGSVSKIFLIA